MTFQLAENNAEIYFSKRMSTAQVKGLSHGILASFVKDKNLQYRRNMHRSHDTFQNFRSRLLLSSSVTDRARGHIFANSFKGTFLKCKT